MNYRKITADGCLAIAILIIIYFTNELVFIPLNEPYSFETVAKVSEQYPQPLYITFQWETADELQVGKLITFGAEIRGFPYTIEDEPLEKIEFKFNERHLNYWNEESDIDKNIVLEHDSIELIPDWDKNVFRSQKIDIRFIIPTDITLELCDQNIQECILIENIIHPAPHDLAIQVETNRIGIGVSLLIVVFSSVIVWSKLRPK